MTEAHERFQRLLQDDEVVPPPENLRGEVAIRDYAAFYERFTRDVEKSWAEVAGEFEWYEPWQEVLDWQYPRARWFVGGKTNITLNALDRHARGARRNKVALIWVGEDGTERTFTYGNLTREVNRLANGFKSLGIGKGDRICIYMPLVPEGIFAMLAAARIGAVHSVVYAGLGAGALRQRIEDAGARAVLTADVGYRRGKTTRLKEIVDQAVAGLEQVEHVVVLRREEEAAPLKEGEIDYHELIRGRSFEYQPAVMESEDPLFILYTSGTTGRPKGAVYAHGGYMVGVTTTLKWALDLRDDDVYWCTSDIGWIVGHSIMVYGPFCLGTTVLIREGAPDYPEPGVTWSLVEKYGVTKFYTAPTAVRMFMRFGEEYPRRYDLSTLKVLACAGEPLNPEAWRWFHEHIGQGRAAVCDNWWQTETAAPTIGTFPAQPAKPGKAGLPFPGIRADVVDRQGRPVAPNQGGFLVLKNPWPHMFRTVWGHHERYEEYWRTIDGVYTAGDVATKDEDGYIQVLGRADDVLNVAGHRIGTADVESALVSHPAVAEAAVIGKPDPIKGEAIKAFVILRMGEKAEPGLEERLTRHVREVLGPIATPSEIEIVSKLPKTRSGKIMRRVLKARELGLDPGDITTIEE